MSELLQTLASYVPGLMTRRIAADPTPITTATAERFPAAVLFADISGFTPLTERLAQRGPAGLEFLTQLLNSYFGQLVDVITDHGGDVVKFAGDALIALWPAADAEAAQAISLQEATRLATQCGATIQGSLHDWETAEGVRLSLRFTVAAGEVFLVHVGGAYNRWEFVVTGRPLGQVSAAEKIARPGEVVLTPRAWELVADFCRGTALADGHVRLESIQELPHTRPAPVTPVTAAMEAGLRAYIPGAILARLSAGQGGWLAELRRVTVLFIDLPDLNYTTPLEQAQQTMRALQGALYRFEGSVNKISVDDKGTTLVAVMGLPPVVHEDDPV
ncbi:MAG TPA: adenylate/guanylate cyclase domain-containing protein, partial [Anaerolineae bacterium]